MDKFMELTGGEASQFAQRIKRIGYNKDVTIELATVITPPPALSVKLSDGITLDYRNNLFVAQDIAPHTREAVIGGVLQTVEFKSAVAAGDVVLVATDGERSFYAVIDKAARAVKA